jgi:hypothetical protein
MACVGVPYHSCPSRGVDPSLTRRSARPGDGGCGAQVTALMQAAFTEPIDMPAGKMLRCSFLVGGGKKVRQKYSESLSKDIANVRSLPLPRPLTQPSPEAPPPDPIGGGLRFEGWAWRELTGRGETARRRFPPLASRTTAARRACSSARWAHSRHTCLPLHSYLPPRPHWSSLRRDTNALTVGL